MHRIQGWTGLRAAVIALGLVAWTATGATASPLFYTTSGQVDTTTGVSSSTGGTPDSTPNNVVSLVPLTSGNSVELSTGQTNASLGNFVITSPGDNTTTTYHDTPIRISFQPQSYNGTSISSDAPVVVSGVLNGVVNGPSSSTVTATFKPPSPSMLSLVRKWHGRVQPADQHAPAGSLDLQQRHDLRAGPGHVQHRFGVSGSRTKHDRPVPDDRGRAWPAPLRSVPSPFSQGLKFVASGPFWPMIPG